MSSISSDGHLTDWSRTAQFASVVVFIALDIHAYAVLPLLINRNKIFFKFKSSNINAKKFKMMCKCVNGQLNS